MKLMRVAALLGAAALAVSACTSSAATASPAASATPAAPSATPAPTPTAAPSATNVTAPSPLPAFNTGLIWNEGECWDMDSGSMVAGPTCDFRLDHILTIVPQNGALISGLGKFDPPSLATCAADAGLLPDVLAPNGGIYLCTKTNQGVYGFIIQRPDAPGAPSTRLILDFWLYK